MGEDRTGKIFFLQHPGTHTVPAAYKKMEMRLSLSSLFVSNIKHGYCLAIV